MNKSRWFFAGVMIALMGAGCSDDPPSEPTTAIIVEVDSDLDVPAELDEIRVSATAGSSELDAGDQTASGSLEDGGLELPVRVVLVPAGGATTVRVLAEGYLNGVRVRMQAIRTEFVANEVVTRHMELAKACDIECPDGKTCVATGGNARCESEVIDLEDLDGGDGDGDGGAGDSGLDGGDGDGDAAMCDDEICNGRDDDCDEEIDNGATICPQDMPFATAACRPDDGGVKSCQVAGCTDDLHLDCTADPGCETEIDATHCGSCAMDCGENSFCAHVASGSNGWECRGDCGTSEVCGTSCTNTMINPSHCGACEHECPLLPNATQTCEGGKCVLSCVEGFLSCDGYVIDSDGYLNGCETNYKTDVENCGTCGHSCPDPANSTPVCDDGDCNFRCDTGYDDCSGGVANGCETSLNADPNCGACTIDCTGLESCCSKGGMSHCSTLALCL